MPEKQEQEQEQETDQQQLVQDGQEGEQDNAEVEPPVSESGLLGPISVL